MASEGTLGRVRRRVLGVLDALRSLSNRILIVAKDREDAARAAKDSIPSIQERQDELISFYRNYEELIEVLCDCAQVGPNPKLETEYQRLKAWMNSNYGPVRKYVVAFLLYSSEDAEQGIALWGRSADAFEALVAAPDLDEFLRADDGSMISRINRTREALNLYGEHLRQLAASS